MNGKKKNIMLLLLLAGILGCFCSCVAGTKAREDKAVAPYVWLTDRSKYNVTAPQDIEHPLDMPQLVSASYRGKDYFLDETVSFSSAMFPPSLKPEYIVADFQLCFYEGNFE